MSQIWRGWNRGFLLVKSGKSRPLIGWERMISQIKPSAFRPEIPVIQLILASFRRFWSHSWDEISFCRHRIHYGMTAVWLIHIILESWEWGSNWRMRKWKKLLQSETASQKSIQNGLNKAEMKEILRPNSNLEGPKSRLPIGQEPKIEASDWSRADDFKNSSHRPFVKKFLSLHSFWHH